MRKLVTIREIADIRPIPEADNIVQVIVDGWSLVSQKTNGFQVGDKVVYMEIDSLVPTDNPTFAFLANRGIHTVDGKSYHRLKSIKLKKTMSQGLILPVSEVFPNGIPEVTFDEETDFLAELLGVIKYEPQVPAHLSGRIKGNFPMFVPKTDEERIQNCWRDVKRYYPDDTYEVTEKLDGSSMTVYLNEDTFGVCSRNLDLVEEEGNAFWATARKYGLEEKLSSFGRNIALQGELVGPGVQKNIYGLKELEYRIFNIYDIDAKRYLNAEERHMIILDLGLRSVPVLGNFRFDFENIDDFLAYVEGSSALSPKGQQITREGLVYKSIDNPSWSFKGISNRFLLKHDG
jgi:RNA ligase (TIGR02306 family)